MISFGQVAGCLGELGIWEVGHIELGRVAGKMEKSVVEVEVVKDEHWWEMEVEEKNH